MRALAIGLFVIVTLGALLIGGFWLWATAQSTRCVAVFPTRSAAEAAAEAAEREGFTTLVDHRARNSAVEFDHDDTGDEARAARRTFRRIVRRHDGALGRPGGCIERQPLGG